MTVVNQLARRQFAYAGPGSPTFPYYDLLFPDELQVYKVDSAGVDTPLTYGTHYTVTINSDSTSSATLTTAGIAFLADHIGGQVDLLRVPHLSQLTRYTEQGAFPALSHEHGLDHVVHICQWLNDRIDHNHGLDGAPGEPGAPAAPGTDGTDGLTPEFRHIGPIIQTKYTTEPDTAWRDVIDVSQYGTKIYADKTELSGVDVGAATGVLLQGWNAAGDQGQILSAQVVNAQPAHTLFVPLANGKFAELVLDTVNPELFGAVGNNAFDCLAAFQAMAAYPHATKVDFKIIGGPFAYKVTQPIDFKDGVLVDGHANVIVGHIEWTDTSGIQTELSNLVVNGHCFTSGQIKLINIASNGGSIQNTGFSADILGCSAIGSPDAMPIRLYGQSDCTVQNNTVIANGTTNSKGIYVQLQTGGQSLRVKVSQNKVQSFVGSATFSYGIHTVDCDAFVFDNDVTATCTTAGVMCENTAAASGASYAEVYANRIPASSTPIWVRAAAVNRLAAVVRTHFGLMAAAVIKYAGLSTGYFIQNYRSGNNGQATPTSDGSATSTSIVSA